MTDAASPDVATHAAPARRVDHVRQAATAMAEAAERRSGGAKTARGRITAKPPKRTARSKPQAPQAPTPERLAKGDVVRTTGGAMVAEGGLDRLRRNFRRDAASHDVLTRLHHRAQLDKDPGMSDRMYEAGKLYEELAHRAGLSGVAAQNLLSCGGGGGDPAHSMPGSLAAAAARKRLRKAWDILPDEVAIAVHGLLVSGDDPETVGRRGSNYRDRAACIVAGTTMLRIGLALLVAQRWA